MIERHYTTRELAGLLPSILRRSGGRRAADGFGPFGRSRTPLPGDRSAEGWTSAVGEQAA